ncbi:MAG: hypothetical protein WCO85_07085 [Actinomycetes bacterium]|jgi:hypothetical protein
MTEEKSTKPQRHYLPIPEDIANLDDKQIDEFAASIYEQIIKALQSGKK